MADSDVGQTGPDVTRKPGDTSLRAFILPTV